MTRRGRFALAAAAVVWAAPAASTDAPTELAPIQVTAGRESAPQYAVAQPLTVLDSEEIAERAPQVLARALAYEPGAFVQQSGPGQGIVIVRGLKGSEVLHRVDGMRLNNAFFRNSPSQYFALVDPQNVERIELLRGPYATVYGSDAMGGVVQVLTPEYRFDTDAWGWRGGARATYASADLARGARSYLAAGNRSFSLAAGFSFSECESPPGSGNLSEPNGTTFFSPFPDGSRADDIGLYLLDAWTITPDWLLDAGARYTYRNTVIARGDRAFGAKLSDHDVTGNLGLRYAVTPRLSRAEPVRPGAGRAARQQPRGGGQPRPEAGKRDDGRYWPQAESGPAGR